MLSSVQCVYIILCIRQLLLFSQPDWPLLINMVNFCIMYSVLGYSCQRANERHCNPKVTSSLQRQGRKTPRWATGGQVRRM